MLKSDMLFVDFLPEWLQEQKPYISITSWEGYEIVVTHIVTFFSLFRLEHLKLCDIKGSHLQEYYNYMMQELEYSPTTMKKHNAVLHKAFEDCIFAEILHFNPCERTRLPRKKHINTNVYSSVDMQELLKLVQGHYLEAPIFLTAYYGFRRGEVLGLKWSDIDYGGKYIKVHRSYTKVRTSVIKDSLKSDSSYRIMPLFDTVIEFLHQLEQSQEDLKIYGADDFICKTPKGALISPNALSKGFNRFLQDNGLPHIRFHDLRHSNLSLLLNNGMSLKHISEWAGHSNINITADTYSHLDYSSKIIMGDKINEILKGE